MTEQPTYPEIRNPVKAIRAFCLQCAGGAYYVPDCPSERTCPLWPYRTGKNPFRTPPSEAQQEAARQNIEKASYALTNRA